MNNLVEIKDRSFDSFKKQVNKKSIIIFYGENAIIIERVATNVFVACGYKVNWWGRMEIYGEGELKEFFEKWVIEQEGELNCSYC